MNIQKLSAQLINQIAAGEVVERPLSVVKELVENAIDAGATRVQIRIVEGGIQKIEVIDNGVGIHPDQLKLALTKHATSKIQSLDDLYQVMSFGFRGEALASIASVSEFTLTSCTQDQIGARQIQNTPEGEFKISEVPGPQGTKVSIENIFYNTPARKNYLKTSRTEYLKIYEFLQKIALVYPEVGFSFTHDEKAVFDFPSFQSSAERLYSIYGEDFYGNMLELHHDFGGIRMTGYMSNPKIFYKNKHKQLLSVNRRIVTSPIVLKAFADAYSRFIPHGVYSAYSINLEIDPTQVDVNIHPRKLELRFADEQSVFRAVYHGVKNSLQNVTLSSNSELGTQRDHIRHISVSEPEPIKYHSSSGTNFKSYSPYTNTSSNPAQKSISFTQAILGSQGESNVAEEKTWKVIGQLHKAYIIVETQQGVQILDQHAVAERVIYERLIQRSYIPKVQSLLVSEGLRLSPIQYSVYNEYRQVIADMGFVIEELSHQNISVQGIPDFCKKENIAELMSDIINDISSLGSISLDEVRNKIYAYTACRSAVKFGDVLSLFEMEKLVEDAYLDYSATCPHGRPVVYEVSLDDMKKKYER